MKVKDSRGVSIEVGTPVAYVENGGHYRRSVLRQGVVVDFSTYHDSEQVHSMGIRSDRGTKVFRTPEEVLVLVEVK